MTEKKGTGPPVRTLASYAKSRTCPLFSLRLKLQIDALLLRVDLDNLEAPDLAGALSGAFDRVARAPYTDGMEVHFSPDQIAQLAQIAAQEGVDTEKLVKDAALKLLQDDEHFRAAVRRGLEQADRDEFIEEDEMDARIKRMFQS